jgi:hypothetical protein
MKKDKKDLGNNYFKSGWQPSAEFDESTGLGEITHIGQDPNYKSKFDTILKDWGFDHNLKVVQLKPFMRSKEWSEGDIQSVMSGMTSY